MTSLQSGREERFRALFSDAYQDVLRFAQRRVHPSHAEDAVAEAFLVVWRRFDDAPDHAGDLRAWLFGITRNCLLNARRGQDRSEALAVRLADMASSRDRADSPATELSRGVEMAAAWKAIERPGAGSAGVDRVR